MEDNTPIESGFGTMIRGKEVIYTGSSDEQVRWGGNDDPRGLLAEGERYEVEDVEVHSWHTKLTLRGFPGKKFNSASFERPLK